MLETFLAHIGRVLRVDCLRNQRDYRALGIVTYCV